MPPHEQQPAPVAPAAPGDSQRPPILDVVVKGEDEEYPGRYVLTEEERNSAPVWQQLGSERCLYYAALAEDPAQVMRWVLCRPAPPSETESKWICDLMAAEGCSASTPPQSAGAWVDGYADVTSRVPASVSITVPDQEIAAVRRAAAAQLESELAARETAEAALAAERRRSRAAQAEKWAAERALGEERRRAAAALAEEQRRAAAALESERAERRAAEQALAAERRRAAAALSARQDAELQLRGEAEGRRAEGAKRLTVEEVAARRALELEGASALADMLLDSQTVAATISAAERAGRLEREADLRLAEAATQLPAEEAAGRQKVHAAAFEGFCDLHQRWAGAVARAAERRRSAQGQLSATAVDEAEQRRAAEAQCLAELAAVFREAASAERRAGGREALAVAEADARAAAEAEQRATRAEAMREWERRAAQLHRAAAAEELGRARTAADAERERAAAAERAAALAEERVRGAEQQAAEAGRAASQAEEALRAAEGRAEQAEDGLAALRSELAAALERSAAAKASLERLAAEHEALRGDVAELNASGVLLRVRGQEVAAPPPPAAAWQRRTARRRSPSTPPPERTVDQVRGRFAAVLQELRDLPEQLDRIQGWELRVGVSRGKPQWVVYVKGVTLSKSAKSLLTAHFLSGFPVPGHFHICDAAEAEAAPDFSEGYE